MTKKKGPEPKVMPTRKPHPFRLEIFKIWHRNQDKKLGLLLDEMEVVSQKKIPRQTLAAFVSHFRHGRKINEEIQSWLDQQGKPKRTRSRSKKSPVENPPQSNPDTQDQGEMKN